MGMPESPSCSAYVDEPLPGTASVETDWLLIESDGGWDRDVYSGDALGPARERIREFAAAHRLRVLLIRRPGGPRSGAAERIVFRADSVTGTLRRFAVTDLADIPDLRPADGVDADPIAVVCTNGKRDVCCAVRGRPVAAALAARYPEPVVWECSHTGGHRFAPVLIVLPTGYTYGRVTEASAERVFDAARAGLVLTEGLRGRSPLPPVGQVAEVAVRERLGVAPSSAVTVTVDGDRAQVAAAGRNWRVRVEAEVLPDRPASCGKTAGPARAWRVREFREV
jgi:hypothetical protein